MSTEQTIEFVPLLGFEDSYEILNKYPFTIRNKNTLNNMCEHFDKDGYVVLNLTKNQHQGSYKKHRLIALQFIPNPNNLPEVDHKNHVRDDNRIENLRWSNHGGNVMNRQIFKGVNYQFVDDIPDDAIQINEYGNHTFEEGKYYYYFNEDTNEDIFYGKITDDIYKILHHNTKKGGGVFVQCRDINSKNVCIYINKFKQLYDL
ncbi:hypothetical protein M9Y10_031066 [Tritrichomonas musculus]|uniref:HNH nuclease domain-containing protein n=1 Tax=Tritrichomonas musculus TaxID=1915356 RepID=A0ABR2H1Q7_9EUKA